MMEGLSQELPWSIFAAIRRSPFLVVPTREILKWRSPRRAPGDGDWGAEGDFLTFEREADRALGEPDYTLPARTTAARPAVNYLVAASDASPTRRSALLPLMSRKAIIAGGGAGRHIAVAPNAEAKGAAPWYEARGASMVPSNEGAIAEMASKYKLDPDLIRAVAYVESTHGYYDAPLEALGLNSSSRPMNINTSYWGDAWGSKAALREPRENVEAGAKMLRSISNAMPGASVAEIASVYNNSNAQKVSDYGARVGGVMRDKAWLPPKPPRTPARIP
jgi:hypothetical protein